MTGARQSYRFIVAGLAVPQLSSIALVALTAWAMGPAGRGEIAFGQATAAAMSVIGGWGFYLSAAAARENLIPRQYLELTVGFTAVLAAGLLVLAAVVPRGLLAIPLAIPIGLAAVMMAGSTYCQRIAQARVGDREYLLLGAITPTVSLIVVVPAVLLDADPDAVVAIWALGTAVGFLIAVGRTWSLGGVSRPAGVAISALVRGGFAVGAANVASFLVMRADTVILGVASTATQVGFYSIAVAMSGLVMYVAEALSLRTISDHAGSRGGDAFRVESYRRARRAAGLSALLVILMLPTGWVVLDLVLPEFRPAFAAFGLLCLAAIPAAFVRVLVSAASMLGMRRLLAYYSVASVLLVCTYVPFAPFGAQALAWASLLIYTIQALFVGSWMHWTKSPAAARSSLQ